MSATTRMPALSAAFQPLRDQLVAAAEAFSTEPLGELMNGLVDDVERAMGEPLEIFPVAHHSPAAALHLVRRIANSPPKVIFIELCEDLRPLVDKLRDCKLPVALQAFASASDAFPKAWAPLSVVAPLTEFSAEYQAIAYALEHPETDLVFVDQSVDHVFQWMPQRDDELKRHLGGEPDRADESGPAAEPGEADAGPSHGAAVGVQVGDLEPTLGLFHDFLLNNARVRNFQEWREQYVEQPVLTGDYDTYRQVLFLIGSLFRRLGRKDEDRASDCDRERFMWTRMKDYLVAHRISPRDALHICGAVHAVSEVAEYGAENPLRWEIPARTATSWLYGLIPSSHAAIDAQFHFPPGTVTLSEALWEKGRRQLDVKPFALAEASKKSKAKPKPRPAPPTAAASEPATNGETLLNYLVHPPAPAQEDESQLLSWCVGIVALARKHGYLSSTADSIAIYHSAVLLAQLRNRRHPTPYDFRDAAITCLEKDRTPRKRDIARLCDQMIGGDRIGRIGFDSLPPLAQDVYDRLAPLGINLAATTIQRALLDLRARPELREPSRLLWKLAYLLGNRRVVRPIMGRLALGETPIQESWDIAVGREQTPVLMLAYEGVTVEQVLEKRLRVRAFASEATAATALAATEDCLLYLESPRLTEELGRQAVVLLGLETGAQTAAEIFDRVRRLVHYYRSTQGGLPDWVGRFVSTGYSQYAKLLPGAFEDRGTTPAQVSGMLAFLFTLEGLALSLGCQRSELVIAVRQSRTATDDPNKIGLLWTAEWLVGLRSVDEIRAAFEALLANPLTLDALPDYLSGFLLALQFTPLVGPLAVEFLSRAFETLPSSILMPWLPSLIMMLRQLDRSVLPTLLKEVSAIFPQSLATLESWQPPWAQTVAVEPAGPRPEAEVAALSADEAEVARFLAEFADAAIAHARLLGLDVSRPAVAGAPSSPPSGEQPVASLLREFPETAEALAALLRV